jgi:hypothetical protein
MVLALSTPASLATGAVLLLLLLARRLFGRWLMRRGAAMEASRHGPLPGGYMDPAAPPHRASEQAPAGEEPERYDPFNAG